MCLSLLFGVVSDATWAKAIWIDGMWRRALGHRTRHDAMGEDDFTDAPDEIEE